MKDPEKPQNTISFAEDYSGGGICTLVVRGLTLPHTQFDPLAKLWSMLRRRFREWYKVDTVGIFIYDDVKATIGCNFYLNYAEGDSAELNSRFEKAAPPMMRTFEEVILAFLDDDDSGFMAYAKLSATNTAYNDFVRLFNTFLRSVKLRTEADDKRVQREFKKAKKEAAERHH